MADSSVPNPSGSDPSNSSSMPPADWCAEQWSVLCDLLDVSDPREVVPQVRRLGGEQSTSSGGPSARTSDAVHEAFEDMQAQLQTLQDRNAQLMEHLESEPSPSSSSDNKSSPSPDAEALLDHLDVSSMATARERVESLTEQLDHLYREKERLAEAGLMSADDILDELDRLQRKCDRLEQEHDASSTSEAPHSTDESPAATVLDVDDRSTADEVAALATDAHDALEQTIHDWGLNGSSPSTPATTFPDLLRSIQNHATTLRDGAGTETTDSEIGEILGLDTPDDARELETIVQRMTDSLQTLRDERQTLQDELGVDTSEDILDLVQSLETQLSAFYEQQERNNEVVEEVEEVLGISTAEEARELAEMVRRMNERLEDVDDQPDPLSEAGYDADTALATINSMEKQLVALYEKRDAASSSTEDSAASGPEDARLADTVTEVLGLTTPDEVEQMDESVRQMTNRLDALEADQQILNDANLTAEEAVDMINSMNDQLSSLYNARDERTERLSRQIKQLGTFFGFVPPDASSPETALDQLAGAAESLLSTATHPLPTEESPDSLADAVQVLIAEVESAPDTDSHQELEAIKETLGISTVEEADELASLTREMNDQLEAFQADQECLQDAGIPSVQSAVEMIESLSTQLDELYEEQELLQNQSSPAAEQQDTFEQLASLYSEQEKLERKLGVSGADDVIEMVEALTAQLEELYSDRKADSPSDADIEPPSFEVAPRTNGTESTSENADANADDSLLQSQILDSLTDQLEALYAEKDALLEAGVSDAEKAAERINELERRLDTLQHEHEQCHDRLGRLQDKLGTAQVDEIVEMVEAPTPSDGDAQADRPAPNASSPPTPPSTEVPKEAPPSSGSSPSLLPDDTLSQLDDMEEEALDALSVGVVRLDDNGHIDYLNESGFQLPGLDERAPRSELVGEVLFEIVPSTSNTLFLNRFRDGVDKGRLNTRFSYTFLSPQQPPTAFFVHLYRGRASGANWLLFEPAD